jgi:hypothetical protein
VKTFTPEDDQSEEKGHTDGSDVQLHGAWGPLGFDLIQHKFKGFYEQTGQSEDLIIHSGLEMERSAVNLFLISDPDSFQYDAAFSQTAYSDASGWTFILMLSADQSVLSGLPASLTADLTSQSANAATEIKVQTVGVLGGVGGRLITSNVGWFSGAFLAVAVLVGPALQENQTKYADGATEKKSQVETLKTNARFSLGFDKGSWFAGGSFMGDSSMLPGEKIDLQLSSNQIESFFGMRL